MGRSKASGDAPFRDQWRLREKAYSRIKLRHQEPGAPPLYEQLREGLRGLILEGHLHADDVLMPRRHLCEKFDVNRVIVNQAIRDLLQEGLLSSQHGRGVFVNSVSPWTVGLVANVTRADFLKKPLVSYSLIAHVAME